MSDPLPPLSGATTSFSARLSASTPEARAEADLLSTRLLALQVAQPLSRDLFFKGAALGDWRGAFGASVIDGATQAFSLGLGAASRPVLREAGGATSTYAQAAWTTVGLAISHRLWDSGAPASLGEIGSLTLAAGATQALRAVADGDQFTDGLASAALGLGTGLLVPALAQAVGLGYDHWSRPTLSHGLVMSPFFSPNLNGATMGIQGVF